MINLLPRNEQRQIYHEYLLRIGTLVFFAIGIVGTVFIIVLVPSYMRLEGEIASVDSELKGKQLQMTSENQGQVSEAKEFMSEIQVLRSAGATSSVVAFMERIIALKPARVVLIGFQYDISEGKSKIGVTGKADRREDLLEFKSKLESQAGFRGIELPAQTLIKRTDIQFSMDLSGKEIKAVPTPPPSSQDELIPLP